MEIESQVAESCHYRLWEMSDGQLMVTEMDDLNDLAWFISLADAERWLEEQETALQEAE